MAATLFQLSDNIERKANELFNKTDKEAAEDVLLIKRWMKTQYHFPENLEEREIRNFLVLNKYKMDKTKEKIDMYYTLRSLIPEIYETSNPKLPNMELLMDTTWATVAQLKISCNFTSFYSICCVHPRLTENLLRIYFFKPKSPNTFIINDFANQCSNISEIRLHEDCMVGDILIFDMRHLTLSDITKVNPIVLAKYTKIYENVYSMRIKQAYIINSPGYVTKLMALLKMVVKVKILNRIIVCQDESVLNEVLGEDDLPKDYGGKGPSLEELNELMKMKLKQYEKRFDDLDEMKVNENLRPENLGNADGEYCFGSFRQLNVD